jgi:hypothetical protein
MVQFRLVDWAEVCEGFLLQRTGGCPCDLFHRDTDNRDEYNIHVKGTINPKEMCTLSRSLFTGVVVGRCTI